jgi:hypothetical protein
MIIKHVHVYQVIILVTKLVFLVFYLVFNVLHKHNVLLMIVKMLFLEDIYQEINVFHVITPV